jgi:hypothetical protein
MAGRKDPAAELGEKLLRGLESQRALGTHAYPLSVRRLAELVEPTATTVQINKALGKRAFQTQAIVARKADLDAPLALVADAELLAASRLLLEYLLQTLRTSANQAFSPSTLKAKVTSKLQKPFAAAVERLIGAAALPPTIGWLSINRSKKLFLLSDIHTTGSASSAQVEARPPTPPAPIAIQVPDFAYRFAMAFQELDRQTGGHNFVSLVELRRAVPLAREVFDRELHQLRLTGEYSLCAAEGRHGLRPEEQDAGIVEDGTLLLYVSRKGL